MKRLFPLLFICLVIACSEEEPESNDVIEISIKTPPKNKYLAGELLDLSGLVVALTKGDHDTVSLVAFANFSQAGITSSVQNGAVVTSALTSVTFTYTGSGESTSQEISVGVVTELTIKTPPLTVEYFVGQTLNLANLEITLKSDNGATKDIALDGFDTYGIATIPANGSELALEDSEVTIEHISSGKNVSQAITVTGFTNETTVSDVDGNTYKIVKIGSQFWMQENLKTTRYQNEDEIGTTTPPDLNILNEQTPKYQWAYNGDEEDVAIYGRLYTQFAAYDERNICPRGWRIPSRADFEALQQYLITNGHNWDGSTEGNKLGKSIASPLYWEEELFAEGAPGMDPESNNSSGFTGLGSGVRTNITDNEFLGRNVFTFWWSSDSNEDGLGIAFRIQSFMIEADIGTMGDLNQGAPCRCLKN